MASFQETLFNLFSGTVESIGESKLVEVLQTLHDTNLDQYKAAIFGGIALTKALAPLTAKSSTKVDDVLVQAIEEALTESAKNNSLAI